MTSTEQSLAKIAAALTDLARAGGGHSPGPIEYLCMVVKDGTQAMAGASDSSGRRIENAIEGVNNNLYAMTEAFKEIAIAIEHVAEAITDRKTGGEQP